MSPAEYIMARIMTMQRQTGLTPSVVDAEPSLYEELCTELGSRGDTGRGYCVINGVMIVRGYVRGGKEYTSNAADDSYWERNIR